MTFQSPLSSRILVSALLLLLAGSPAAAQTNNNRPRANTRTTLPTGSGGGSSGGMANATTRQYSNSTMVGDAMITSDLNTRRIIVVTDEETNANIKTIIDSLDQPKPQVLINVVFLQVDHDKGLDIGAEASYRGIFTTSPQTTGTATTQFGIAASQALPTTYGAFYNIVGNDVNTTIHLLANSNKTQILSRPSILTRSGQQASVMVGQSIPIITNSQVSSVTNAITNTVTYQDIGIILSVTPFITAEGNVEMIVSPQTSSLSATTVPISNGVSSPVINKTSADTVVVTPSDQTIVIGGLISNQKTNTQNKVPILGDIPLLGNLFKRTVNGTNQSELLIFLTPHVVRNPEDLSRLAQSERAKTDLLPKTGDKENIERYIGDR